MIGAVEKYDEELGYGFIRTEAGSSIFLHASELKKGGVKASKPGDRLTFEVDMTSRGPRAIKVARI
jgi:CspA family cold shock protein